jgi:S1-C subfamily serine protease
MWTGYSISLTRRKTWYARSGFWRLISIIAFWGVLPDLRIKSGVVVVANSAYSRAVDARLRPGDVIHAINTKPILSLDDLRRELAAFHAGAAVVLQIERSDGMDYVAFEID